MLNFRLNLLILFSLFLLFLVPEGVSAGSVAVCGPNTCQCVGIITGHVYCQATTYSSNAAVVCKCGLTANCYVSTGPSNTWCSGDYVKGFECTSASISGSSVTINYGKTTIADCGRTSDGWGNYYRCSGSYLQRLWVDYYCNRISSTRARCDSDVSFRNCSYCGSYCGSWGENYCSDGDVWHKRVCYSRDCDVSGWNGRGYTTGSCDIDSYYNDYDKVEDCSDSGKVCQNGQCVALSPSVDIKANGSNGPITIDYNDSADLTWSSENVDSCFASDDWSGSKSTSGSQSTGSLTSSKKYAINCSGPGGSVSDSVQVNVSSQPTLSVYLKATPSSGEVPLRNVDLEASVSGTAQGSINYKFDCENDGVWDEEITSDAGSYTAENLCAYSSPGEYEAKVKVERGDADPSEDTILIEVSAKPNHPPNARFSCSIQGCYSYSSPLGPFLEMENESNDPDGNDDIIKSEWDIINYGSSPNETFKEENVFNNYPVPSPSLPVGDYEVKLTVTDEAGETDSEIKEMVIRKDIKADFLCSLSGQEGDWHDCNEFKGIQEKHTYFKDNSSLSDEAENFVERTWKLEGEVFEEGTGNDPVSTSSVIIPERSNTVELIVIDDEGRTGTTSYNFEGRLPLPSWQEVGS
jgi:hypothetical protein